MLLVLPLAVAATPPPPPLPPSPYPAARSSDSAMIDATYAYTYARSPEGLFRYPAYILFLHDIELVKKKEGGNPELRSGVARF